MPEQQPNKGINEGIRPNTLSVRGNKIGLGPWLDLYFDGWIQALQDPEVSLLGNGSFLMDTREGEVQAFIQTRKDGGANFAIFALPDTKLIGVSGLFRLNRLFQTAHLGISIFDKDYWGKGYGTEAVKLTVDYGFRFLNLHSVFLDTSSFNERAVKSYRKAGFKEIGRWREAQSVAGKRYDEVFMDCLRSEFVSPSPGWFDLEGK